MPRPHHPAAGPNLGSSLRSRSGGSRTEVHLWLGAALIAYGTAILGVAIGLLILGPQTAGTGVASTLLITVASAAIFGGFVKLGVKVGSILR